MSSLRNLHTDLRLTTQVSRREKARLQRAQSETNLNKPSIREAAPPKRKLSVSTLPKPQKHTPELKTVSKDIRSHRAEQAKTGQHNRTHDALPPKWKYLSFGASNSLKQTSTDAPPTEVPLLNPDEGDLASVEEKVMADVPSDVQATLAQLLSPAGITDSVDQNKYLRALDGACLCTEKTIYEITTSKTTGEASVVSIIAINAYTHDSSDPSTLVERSLESIDDYKQSSAQQVRVAKVNITLETAQKIATSRNPLKSLRVRVINPVVNEFKSQLSPEELEKFNKKEYSEFFRPSTSQKWSSVSNVPFFTAKVN